MGGEGDDGSREEWDADEQEEGKGEGKSEEEEEEEEEEGTTEEWSGRLKEPEGGGAQLE